MIADRAAKIITKIYARTLLSEWRGLTQELYDKINNGDESTIRSILVKQKNKILAQAENEADKIEKDRRESEASSVQEVIDALSEILSA